MASTTSSPDRLDREIFALRDCSHPNIATLDSAHEVSLGSSSFRVVIERYIPGGTLEDRLSLGPLAAENVRDVGMPNRWSEDEQQGGRNIAYWCSEELLTLIRDQEVLRLDREKWFDGNNFSSNPHSERILSVLRSQSGEAWLKLSWLQYLRWFTNMTESISGPDETKALLADAAEAWKKIEKLGMFFLDSFNDGTHIRSWHSAFVEGFKRDC